MFATNSIVRTHTTMTYNSRTAKVFCVTPSKATGGGSRFYLVEVTNSDFETTGYGHRHATALAAITKAAALLGAV